MKIFRHICIFFSVCLYSLLVSCGQKAQPLPLESDFNETGGYYNDIVVPYQEMGGVKTIQVKINNCTEFPMIFDTGCSGLSLSIAEVYVLAKQGCITSKDIEGFGYSTIADGSIVENMILTLHEIRIGDLVCKNIKASVNSNEAAPLLLGNGVLDQVKSFSTDNESKTIIFHL